MDMKRALIPAAFAASFFLAAPAWSAGTNDSATARDRPAASGEHQNGAQNHTQGEVSEKCLREDPRKHPADVACAKLKSKRHPAMKESAHTAAAGTTSH